jgi:hypothetical protein
VTSVKKNSPLALERDGIAWHPLHNGLRIEPQVSLFFNAFVFEIFRLSWCALSDLKAPTYEERHPFAKRHFQEAVVHQRCLS